VSVRRGLALLPGKNLLLAKATDTRPAAALKYLVATLSNPFGEPVPAPTPPLHTSMVPGQVRMPLVAATACLLLKFYVGSRHHGQPIYTIIVFN
jgi:hypothetical protein